MDRNIVIQVSKAIPNYRRRGKGGRVNKVYRKNSLWGQLQKGYKKNPPVKSNFNVNILKGELYRFFNGKQQPSTLEVEKAGKKLMKWVNMPYKKTIAD